MFIANPRFRQVGQAAVLGAGSFAAIAAMVGICYCVTGISLDLFIGSLFAVAIVAPPLAAIAGRLPGMFGIAVGAVLGVACWWWLPVSSGSISVDQCLGCETVLVGFVVAQLAIVQLLMRCGIPAVLVSGMAMPAALAWLAWPIWLSGAMSGSLLQVAVCLHPIFVINGIVPSLGIWSEQQVAYSLTSIGQDAAYQLPRSMWPILIFELGLVAGVASIGWLQDRCRRSPRALTSDN
jgi:hypothetical protein